MATKYKRVAVIGAGPSGAATVRALAQEGVFDTIRVFDQRHEVGGTWVYDEVPDEFPVPRPAAEEKIPVPANLPALTAPAPPDPTVRTGLYQHLDSNVGAEIMSFTYAPFPMINSAFGVSRYGLNNPTRPWKVVKKYLEDLFAPYLQYLSLNTRVEKIEKVDDKWLLTLRRSNLVYQGKTHDFWWQETFDAVIAATGHYLIANIPDVPGLAETARAFPSKFEHSKAWRSANNYVGKRVVVVGGNVSAADIVDELYSVAQAPLIVSQRSSNEALENVFNLPNVVRKPGIKSVSPESGGTVEFADGSRVQNTDKVIFATGYKLSYPYLPFPAVTPENRLAGFYQHIFNIGDPSLAVVGQVKAALSFRVYEYQAVAVARFLAGRSKPLPSVEEQRRWEEDRIRYKGSNNRFHEIKPDLGEYFNGLKQFAGPPAAGTDAYDLPAFQDDWAEKGFEILQLKDKYWRSLRKEKAPATIITTSKPKL
ncbi:hypothetical protein A1O3_04623 [Capronia epimyces CBS 606.96]|uniref:Dimethylaniline monooxygenase (N-oxide forming) n=1 Tax=Capronia epimyces CBS 606.96 TaxID=1182542 RepID=W9Y423_9EURO|nr:uncharacterized protein A1O3_04623 [Capronia epimyces CBS 606.96]EXJ83956.1 hypothetical protein A1O3_04623 [Capronia epimyces CBS 606.96]